jgi:hypothetical protein
MLHLPREQLRVHLRVHQFMKCSWCDENGIRNFGSKQIDFCIQFADVIKYFSLYLKIIQSLACSISQVNSSAAPLETNS